MAISFHFVHAKRAFCARAAPDTVEEVSAKEILFQQYRTAAARVSFSFNPHSTSRRPVNPIEVTQIRNFTLSANGSSARVDGHFTNVWRRRRISAHQEGACANPRHLANRATKRC